MIWTYRREMGISLIDLLQPRSRRPALTGASSIAMNVTFNEDEPGRRKYNGAILAATGIGPACILRKGMTFPPVPGDTITVNRYQDAGGRNLREICTDNGLADRQ